MPCSPGTWRLYYQAKATRSGKTGQDSAASNELDVARQSDCRRPQ